MQTMHTRTKQVAGNHRNGTNVFRVSISEKVSTSRLSSGTKGIDLIVIFFFTKRTGNNIRYLYVATNSFSGQKHDLSDPE